MTPPKTVYPSIDDAPAWSPDGQTIAYCHYGIMEVKPNGGADVDPDSSGIWFINPDGTNPRLFLKGGNLPDWSPDGTRLALVMGAQIFTIKVDGDSLEQLTAEGRNFFPDWSPDRQKIAYDSSKDDPFGANVIWIMNFDGSNKVCVDEHGQGERREPDWSPDGTRIAHTRYIGIVFPEIYVMNPEGGDAVRLTYNTLYDSNPTFSPNGTKIAFSSQKPGEYNQIWVMDSDGSNLRQLTTKGGRYPGWSPDGSKIVYVRESCYEYSSEHGTLWIMDADGSNKRQLTVSPVQ